MIKMKDKQKKMGKNRQEIIKKRVNEDIETITK